MTAKASWHWNYVTVTLCIRQQHAGQRFTDLSKPFDLKPSAHCQTRLDISVASAAWNGFSTTQDCRRRKVWSLDTFRAIHTADVTRQNSFVWSGWRCDLDITGHHWSEKPRNANLVRENCPLLQYATIATSVFTRLLWSEWVSVGRLLERRFLLTLEIPWHFPDIFPDSSRHSYPCCVIHFKHLLRPGSRRVSPD